MTWNRNEALRLADELSAEVERLRRAFDAERQEVIERGEACNKVISERDEQRQENARLMSIIGNDAKDIERMKPVYEAAVKWHAAKCTCGLNSECLPECELETTETALMMAINAALTTTERK